MLIQVTHLEDKPLDAMLDQMYTTEFRMAVKGEEYYLVFKAKADTLKVWPSDTIVNTKFRRTA